MSSRFLLATIFIAIVAAPQWGVTAAPSVNALSESGVRFISEQNGKLSHAFKQRVSAYFSKHASVQSAYLVQVETPNTEPPGTAVALCIVYDGDPSKSVKADVQRIFFNIAQSGYYINVIFLSHAQQMQVSAVAKPFYVRP